MAELQQTDVLSVKSDPPPNGDIVLHPQEGRKMDVWTTTEELELFTDVDEFIKDGESDRTATLTQRNNFDKKTVQFPEDVREALGNPETVKLYRKHTNLYIKPL